MTLELAQHIIDNLLYFTDDTRLVVSFVVFHFFLFFKIHFYLYIFKIIFV